MSAGSAFSQVPADVPCVKSSACVCPSHAAGEISPPCEGKRFFSFNFSGEQRREMQQLLSAVLNGDYEKQSPHKSKGFRVHPKASSTLSKTRGPAEPMRSQCIDFTYQQPSMTDSELSDDEFSVTDEFSDDPVD
jgi:hypothetical protein